MLDIMVRITGEKACHIVENVMSHFLTMTAFDFSSSSQNKKRAQLNLEILLQEREILLINGSFLCFENEKTLITINVTKCAFLSMKHDSKDQ